MTRTNTDYPRLVTLAHGIHNSHNMPSGEFVLADPHATKTVLLGHVPDVHDQLQRLPRQH